MRKGAAPKDTAWLPYPARPSPGTLGETPDTAKRPEEPFDRTAGPRVPAALTSASKGSENSSLKRWTAFRPLPNLPPSPLHSGFRGLRPALRLTNRCGSESFHTDRCTVSTRTADLVSISLAPPGKTESMPGGQFQEGAYPPVSAPEAAVFRTCPRATNTGSRRCGSPAIVREQTFYSPFHPLTVRNSPHDHHGRPQGVTVSPLRSDSRQCAATASSSPASGGLTRPMTRTSTGR
jgi:hypothetical protein